MADSVMIISGGYVAMVLLAVVFLSLAAVLLIILARDWLRRKHEDNEVAREVKRYNKLASKARKGVPSSP
mgnify:FL=1